MTESRGLFGKLPGHGDFIQRELPASFVTPWDEWLQRAVHGSRELIGEPWLDYYLTSPVWRFALSPGVLDEQAWAGILVPSVDSVGRYFPLTMAVPVSHGNPFALQLSAEDWYRQLQDLAIEALQNGLQADQLCERFPEPAYADVVDSVSEVSATYIAGGNTDGIAGSYPALLNQLYRQQYPSYSVWWCAGSQYLAPSTLLSPGLPEPTLYCTMLGAQVKHW
ncbi:type VI secretion system-associated protein TagF [Microbulbifer halophilus]|uniref:Type VI secretion system-associated protein TagF n=1 Tax=Microbulbifer halophilus TaxID=453963 RepID=A0ABW5EH70_9GAMM|nr:type VI secretion system-associated protein TagF [Microbulbifer halophilus]MCW8128140.1 type VI secretion system-associated protein TagF [Microbulbifer halophilus]